VTSPGPGEHDPDVPQVDTVGTEGGVATVADDEATEPVEPTLAEPAPTLSLRDRLVAPMPTDRLWGWLGPILISVVAGVLRFWHLGSPDKIVFDETYYAKDAWSLLNFGYERSVVSVPDGSTPIDAQIITGRTGIFGTDPSYVVHPPIGKWMIALGEAVFGLDPIGWRVSTALVGTLTVLMLARIARRLFRSTLLGCIAGLLLTLDALAIVMSRTALLDNFLAFWIVAGFGFLLIDRDHARARLAERVDAVLAAGGRLTSGGPRIGFRPYRLLAGVCFGFGMATKWSALFVVAACGILTLIWDITARRTAGIRRPYSAGIAYDGVAAFGSLVVASFVTYTVSWTGWFLGSNSCYKTWANSRTDSCSSRYASKNGPDIVTSLISLVPEGVRHAVPDAVRGWWHYHAQMYSFHTGLTSSHPYAAPAWRWLYLGRPTQFEFSSYDTSTSPVPDGVGGKTPLQLCGADRCARDIVGVGTPAIWWAALAALIVCLVVFFTRWDWRAGSILMLVGATYLPWLNYGSRPIFFFYAVVIVPFLILAVTYVLGLLLGPAVRGSPRRIWAAIGVGAYLVLVVWNTAYLYPVVTGEWIPYAGYSARMWFRSWI
jgi:dolichyl-phosphate-mannose--protein O-mannosyl transferase